MDIRLLVLRTPDIKRLADFYSELGLTFDYHQHNNSPFHYTAMVGQTVLEIIRWPGNSMKLISTCDWVSPLKTLMKR